MSVRQSCLADRLGRHLGLTEMERRALAAIEEGERMVARGTLLHGEHAPARDIFVVRRGWLYSSMVLTDGSRQIVELHLPGERAGDTILPAQQAPFALTAATDAIVHVIDKAGFRALFERHPRLALLIHALTQIERIALCDRLASVGRTPARARVAALIVDVRRRLRAGGVDTADGFALPLTQEEIGDAIGLTAVHVNRMLRALVEDGLIARGNGRVRVLDEQRLIGLSQMPDRHGLIDTTWLPPPRE